MNRVPPRLAAFAALVFVGYLVGAEIGLALTFKTDPISLLWLPNSVLLAALLLAPVRWWAWLVLAALPAHFAAELKEGIPPSLVLAWFLGNCCEVLLGAAAVRAITRGPINLARLRHLIAFVVLAGVLAPFLSSFVDRALVHLVGWRPDGYWELWRARYLAHVLTALVMVPAIVTWARTGMAALRSAGARDYIETAALLAALSAVSLSVFRYQSTGAAADALLYAPLPFLLWAAVRLGLLGTTSALLVVVFPAVWAASHGQGPFTNGPPLDNALSLQLLLIAVSVPILFLAAVLTERRRVERALRRNQERLQLALADLRSSEERFVKAFQASPDAMVIIRRIDDRIIEVNDRWEKLFGCARDARERTLTDLGIVATEDYRKADEEMRARGSVRDLPLTLRTLAGELLQTTLTAEPVQMDQEDCFIAIIRDVTEQRRAEREFQEQREQLTHLSRVIMLGELSGGLVHELAQPLSAILSNAEAAQYLLAEEQPDVPELRSIVADIIDGNRQAVEVIRRLRALFKRGRGPVQIIDANDIVLDALRLARGDLVAREIVVVTEFAKSLPPLRADRVQLQQVLLNIIMNACEAMRHTPASEQKIVITTCRQGSDVQIGVRDFGTGISQTAQDRLFEPFFTTKEHGLGLGLSISRSILASHQGRIWAAAEGGEGTTFWLALPAAAHRTQPPAKGAMASHHAGGP